MAQKLNVFNLGQLGVDLVDSPIHTADGTLLSCQNAIISTDNDELALRKREGFVKINSIAAAGQILAIFNVPLP